MTEAQKRLRALLDKQSKARQRMAELAGADALTDETRAEFDGLESGIADTERQLRAARQAVEAEEAEAKAKGKTEPGAGPDPEMRERIELRSKASLGRFLTAAAGTGKLDGPEAELAEAAGLAPGQIPVELWDIPGPAEQRGTEQRAITPAPGTTGINLDPLRPMVFAPSVIDKLSVDMPMVESGTYATGTITAAATADAVAKSAEVPEDAAAFTVVTTGAHRGRRQLELDRGRYRQCRDAKFRRNHERTRFARFERGT